MKLELGAAIVLSPLSDKLYHLPNGDAETSLCGLESDGYALRELLLGRRLCGVCLRRGPARVIAPPEDAEDAPGGARRRKETPGSDAGPRPPRGSPSREPTPDRTVAWVVRRTKRPRKTRERKGRMRKTIALLATIGAFTFAGVAGADIVAENQGTAGTGETATVVLQDVSRTTAFAVGVWSSAEVASPVHVSYNVVCSTPGNNRSGSFDLLAGRFVSDAAYIWVGSPNIADPWYGWSTCNATVTLTQFASSNDITLLGWLASHQ